MALTAARASPRPTRAPLFPALSDAPADSLGVLINRVAKAWRGELDRRLRPLGLTRVQWQALLLIARADGGLTQREIAEHLDIGAPATVALVDRMERDGLVERTPVPGDRRRNAVRTTASSRRLLARIEDAAGALRREILGGLTRSEIETLHALLTKAHGRIEALRT
jgi:MarR family transcriptional regulator for hemolysin